MRLNLFVKSAVIAAGAAVAFSAVAADITGAGATFPYPIYSKWAESYKAATNTGLNYQSIGSGGGIKQIKAKTVDFGASDMPLNPQELEEAGLMQFPAIMGGVVPIVNLDGVAPGQMKMTPEVLANIYLGKITKWNDARNHCIEPWRQAAGDIDITVVSPFGWIGHNVPVDQLPVANQCRFQDRSRCRHGCQMAGRRGWQG